MRYMYEMHTCMYISFHPDSCVCVCIYRMRMRCCCLFPASQCCPRQRTIPRHPPAGSHASWLTPQPNPRHPPVLSRLTFILGTCTIRLKDEDPEMIPFPLFFRKGCILLFDEMSFWWRVYEYVLENGHILTGWKKSLNKTYYIGSVRLDQSWNTKSNLIDQYSSFPPLYIFFAEYMYMLPLSKQISI